MRIKAYLMLGKVIVKKCPAGARKKGENTCENT